MPAEVVAMPSNHTPSESERVYGLELSVDNLTAQMITRHEENVRKLDAILEQVRKTNGRVTRLEYWRGWIMGGMAILGAMLTGLLSLLHLFTGK